MATWKQPFSCQRSPQLANEGCSPQLEKGRLAKCGHCVCSTIPWKRQTPSTGLLRKPRLVLGDHVELVCMWTEFRLFKCLSPEGSPQAQCSEFRMSACWAGLDRQSGSSASPPAICGGTGQQAFLREDFASV